MFTADVVLSAFSRLALLSAGHAPVIHNEALTQCVLFRSYRSTFRTSLQGAPRFEIKKWNAVAMWSWDICADTCAICRNSLNEPSIEYQVIITGSLDQNRVSGTRG